MVSSSAYDAVMSINKLVSQGLSGVEKLLVVIALETWLRYAIVAGLAWLLAYVVFKQRWWLHKIVPHFPRADEVRREIGWSLVTALIYGVVGTATFQLAHHGWTQLYKKVDSRGAVWFWCSIVIAIFVHDAYFYWTHRLMHHPKLFHWFHLVHHRSTNPSPWTAYSFGPLEAVVQAGIFPLLAVMMPLHVWAFMSFMLWQITFNVLGHVGYEFFPHWMLNSWFGKVLNTPTHHVQHHERIRGNYGIYFNIWDRLMGTNHRDYESRFTEIKLRAAGGSSQVFSRRFVESPATRNHDSAMELPTQVESAIDP